MNKFIQFNRDIHSRYSAAFELCGHRDEYGLVIGYGRPEELEDAATRYGLATINMLPPNKNIDYFFIFGFETKILSLCHPINLGHIIYDND